MTTPEHRHAEDLFDFIEASPGPWNAVAALEQRLVGEGYSSLDERDEWCLEPGSQHYVVRGHSSLIAFRIGDGSLAETGFRIIGAHTDSPGLRVKPKAAHASDNLVRLGVEVYGGPILASFTDRDLSLAGLLHLRDSRGGITTRLIRFEQALLRLPNLAIHMNAKVNSEGLKLDKQTELPLILSTLKGELPPADQFTALLARQVHCDPADILTYELVVHDTQPGSFWGAENEFIAIGRIDNLSSCHAGLFALLNARPSPATQVCAFFDHEEIGSESEQGAGGSFLSDILERVAHGQVDDPIGYKRTLANSFLVSADAAHAFHPNFPKAYEPLHTIQMNSGPVIKINANRRYATDGLSAARFSELAHRVHVDCQTYVHRTDLGCGSTIGPMSAARLGISTVDCGVPMWAMHSIRESAGVFDQLQFARVLTEFLGAEALP